MWLTPVIQDIRQQKHPVGTNTGPFITMELYSALCLVFRILTMRIRIQVQVQVKLHSEPDAGVTNKQDTFSKDPHQIFYKLTGKSR